jgi:hypothetical protein
MAKLVEGWGARGGSNATATGRANGANCHPERSEGSDRGREGRLLRRQILRSSRLPQDDGCGLGWVGFAILAVFALGAVSARAAEPDLRLIRSKYYLIHTDLDDVLVFDLGTRMDAMYAEYSRRLSDFDLRDERRPVDVYLFNRKSDYTAFTGTQYLHTGGIFMPARNQIAAYLEGQRDVLRRTLQHEAFHQFASKAIGANLPIWINEGMALLFEEAIWTGDGFLMNQVPPRRVRQLQSDVHNNNLLSFKVLINMSPERWSANLAGDPAVGATQYNQAWAVVHYMAYGDDGRNGARLVTMLKALGNGVEPARAFRESFKLDDETFRARFEEYALALQPTPEAEVMDRHDVLADLCAELAAQGKRFATVAEFRRTVEVMKYQLRYTRGEVSWTAEPASFFRDVSGAAYGAEQLYFEPRRGAALPDLVFRHPGYRVGLRARFYKRGEKFEHEVLVEGARAGAATADVAR